MRASSELGGRDLLQCSQVGLRSSTESPLSSAQGADDVDLIVWSKHNREIPRLFFIDEDSDVLSNHVLFGDDAKAQAGIATIQR